MKRVIIIGGGASGLMAAISAARQGAKVTLIEKNKQTGKKILATGNGRCNFTNRNQDISYYRCDDPEFVQRALDAFSMEDTVRFFETLGILVKDREGYLYPNSGQASSISEVLRLEAQRLKVKLACNTEVLAVERADRTAAQKMQSSGLLVRTEGWTYEADAVILACGSQAAPDTGSDGAGYQFAKMLGHRVVTPLPALTGLCASEKDCPKLSGVRADGKVTLFIDGEWMAENTGEVQFASYGLSGIPVFQVSRWASRALEEGRKCQVTVDLQPFCGERELEEKLRNRMAYAGNRRGGDILLGMFPEKLCTALLERAGISLKKAGDDWTEKEFKNLTCQIKKMTFHIARVRGYEQAQICTGGVPLEELKGISMESRLVPGLYLAGELLDVDGACGGYNLQWAWTSGYLAGRCAACGDSESSEDCVR